MLEVVWDKVFGGLGVTEIGIVTSAIAFFWNQISQAIKRRQDSRKEKADEVLEQAVVLTANCQEAKDKNVCLETENDVTPTLGQQLLSKAVEAAVQIAGSRKLDLEKEYGGKTGLEAATQTTYKKLKSVLRRDK